MRKFTCILQVQIYKQLSKCKWIATFFYGNSKKKIGLSVKLLTRHIRRQMVVTYYQGLNVF